jgi:hypothetical protein
VLKHLLALPGCGFARGADARRGGSARLALGRAGLLTPAKDGTGEAIQPLQRQYSCPFSAPCGRNRALEAATGRLRVVSHARGPVETVQAWLQAAGIGEGLLSGRCNAGAR